MATAKPKAAAPSEEATQYREPTSLNLRQRKLRVLQDVEGVVKRGQTQFGERYKYAKIDDVMAAVRPSMAAHGVDLDFTIDAGLSSRTEFGPTKNGVMQFITTLWVDFALVNADEPTDFLVAKMVGEGIDTGDKGTGKALSYAYKNYLLKTFLLPSGDEGDLEAFAPAETHEPAASSQPKRAEASDLNPDHRKAQGAFFAALNAEGIAKERAQEWLKRNYGIASTKELTTEQLKGARAWALEFTKNSVVMQELTAQGGLDLMEVAKHISATYGVESPAQLNLAEWQELIAWAGKGGAVEKTEDEEDMMDLDSFTKAAAEKLDATPEEGEEA
jgi:hypothetical protein